MINDAAKTLFEEARNLLENNAPNPADASSKFRAFFESQLKSLNLVTREEFDAQQAVLLRTREKLDALEKKIESLENK